MYRRFLSTLEPSPPMHISAKWMWGSVKVRFLICEYEYKANCTHLVGWSLPVTFLCSLFVVVFFFGGGGVGVDSADKFGIDFNGV